jgi:hypothetical protein
MTKFKSRSTERGRGWRNTYNKLREINVKEMSMVEAE